MKAFYAYFYVLLLRPDWLFSLLNSDCPDCEEQNWMVGGESVTENLSLCYLFDTILFCFSFLSGQNKMVGGEFVTENLSLWFSFKAMIFCFEFDLFLGGKNRASSTKIHIENVNKYCNLSRTGEKELMGLSCWCAYKFAM